MLLGTGDYDQRIVEQLSARSLVGDTNADANARLPMNAAMNLLSRVDDAIASGSLGRQAEMLRHVTDLFVIGSPQCTEEDVAVFDSVFTRLAAEIESAARALLATRLAPIPNAPPITIRALALDDAIEVAGPVLKQSGRLDDTTLIEVANTKGPEHLLAISRRPTLSEAVTEVLIVRGDQMQRRATMHGRDIYAISAPLLGEAAERLLDGDFSDPGAHAPAEVFDSNAILTALVPNHATFEILSDDNGDRHFDEMIRHRANTTKGSAPQGHPEGQQ